MIIRGETGRCSKFHILDAHGAVGEAGIDIRTGGGIRTIVQGGDTFYFAYLLTWMEMRYGAADPEPLDRQSVYNQSGVVAMAVREWIRRRWDHLWFH